MRVHFTNLFGQSPRSVALIAQNDTMKIAKELGANELAIYFYDNSQESSGELNSRLDGIVAGVSYGDIVFFQSPSWNSVAWDTSLLHKFRAVQTKLVIIISCLITLRCTIFVMSSSFHRNRCVIDS